MQSVPNDVIDLTHQLVDPATAVARPTTGPETAEINATMDAAAGEAAAAAAAAAAAGPTPATSVARSATEDEGTQVDTELEEGVHEEVPSPRPQHEERVGAPDASSLSSRALYGYSEFRSGGMGPGAESGRQSDTPHAPEEEDALGGVIGRGSAPAPTTGALSDSTNAPRTSLPPPAAGGNTEEEDAKPASTGDGKSGSSKGKKRKRRASESSKAPESDGERCSICLDPWTSKGKHRICTLLCGHLFGQSCIERWLKERRSCPQCGAKVGAKGSNRIIPLYLQNLVAKDTGELETARALLEEEKRLRKQCEAERVRLSINNASLKDQLSRLTQAKNHPGRGGIGGQHSERRRGPLPGSPWPSAGPLATREQAPVFSPRDRSPLPPGSSVSAGEVSLVRDNIDGSRSSGGGNTTSDSRGLSGSACAHPGASAYSQFHRSPLPRPRANGVDSSSDLRRVNSSVGGSGGSGGGSTGGGSSTGSSVSAAATSQGATQGAAAGGVAQTAAAAATAADQKGVVRFGHLLSKDVLSGRVACFAGGAAGALLVSQEFGGTGWSRKHGITKFSLADLRHHKHINLHRQQVRDIKFTPNGGSVGYILSTSFDKTLKVCDLRTDSVVVEYGLEGNGWSCQWSNTTPNQMFCGVVDSTRTAAVQLFDLRSTAGAVRKLRAAARQRQPVHSICHTADDMLLCATMGGVWAWGGGTAGGGGDREDEEEQIASQLQIQTGACCSLSQINGIAVARAATAASSAGFARQAFLVSTRGASASHAVFDLHPPSDSSPRALTGESAAAAAALAAFDGGRTYSMDSESGHTPEAVVGWEARGRTGDAAAAGAGATEGRIGRTEIDDARAYIRSVVGSDARTAEVMAPAAPVERRSWSERWNRFHRIAQGHQSQHTLSRSMLWEPSPGGGLLIAGGDERTNQPWMWTASTGSVCNRLESHRSPVLDLASLQDHSTGRGMFAAVSQTEIKLYQTCVQ